MTRSRWKVCSTPGCPTLTEHRERKCDEHLTAKRAALDSRRPSARARGYDSRWERERAAYVERYGPDCECGCGRRATDVHHIDGLGTDGPRGWDWSNWILLAHACHSRVTASGGSLTVLRRPA